MGSRGLRSPSQLAAPQSPKPGLSTELRVKRAVKRLERVIWVTGCACCDMNANCDQVQFGKNMIKKCQLAIKAIEALGRVERRSQKQEQCLRIALLFAEKPHSVTLETKKSIQSLTTADYHPHIVIEG